MKWFDLLRRSKPAPATPLADIRRSFNEAAADEEHFPSTIDPRIFHVQLILHFFGDLGDGACTRCRLWQGPICPRIEGANPQSRVTAFDLAEAMLRVVPTGIPPCCGSMTALPFPDGRFRCGLCDRIA